MSSVMDINENEVPNREYGHPLHETGNGDY